MALVHIKALFPNLSPSQTGTLQALDELKARGIPEHDPRALLLLRVIKSHQSGLSNAPSKSSHSEDSEPTHLNATQAALFRAQLEAFSHVSRGVAIPSATLSVLRKHVSVTELEALAAPSKIGGQSALVLQKDKLLSEKLQSRATQLTRAVAELEKLSDGSNESDAHRSELKEAAEMELKAIKMWPLQRAVRREVANEMERLLSLQSGTDIDVAFRHSVIHTTTPELAGIGERVELPRRDMDEWIGSSTKAHKEWVNSVLIHHRHFSEHHERVNTSKKKLFRRLHKYLNDKEKREVAMKERLERDRFAALKRNDEAAYLELLAKTKNKRLMHLIQQTDQYLVQMGERVLEAQSATNEAMRARFGEGSSELEDIDKMEEMKLDALKKEMANERMDGQPAAGMSVDPSEANKSETNNDGKEKTSTATGADADDGEQSEPQTFAQLQKTPYYLQIHRIQEKIDKQPDILVGGQLKEYQMDGLNWMVSLFNNRLSGILADEMGLGKTIQTIALVSHLYESRKMMGPFLVVVPLSTLSNWALEFQKWAPVLYSKLVVYKGMPQARKRIWQTQLHSGRQQKNPEERSYSVVLTTFDYVIKDRSFLQRIKWAYIIVDEGHRMKNHNCKLSTTLSQHYDSQFRLILTGTPLQNSLPELWSLLNFLLPSLFHSVENFEKWFNKPFANTGEEVRMNEEESLLVIQRLHKVLRPFLLRRLKTQVEAQLPEKIERIVKVDMSAWQRKLYAQARNGLVAVRGADGSVATKGVLNSLMQLRKVCDHPYMFHSPETIEYDDMIWRTAGKFEFLDRILPKLKLFGHRVLMFSQFTSALDILEIYFKYRDISYLRLDGTTKAESRGDLLAQFNAPNSPYDMFILSTRAGGLGLNLQTADTVILFDSDWNPQADLQAQDRAHRIGQKNDVLVLRLVTQNSVEEKILQAANYKLELDSKIIQAGMFNKNSNANDRRAYLMNLLKEGDDEEANESSDIPDNKQVNALLARSDIEYKTFQQIDRQAAEEERANWAAAGNVGPPPARLVEDHELPDFMKVDLVAMRVAELSKRGRGHRDRTQNVQSEMSDAQFMKMVAEEESGNNFSKEAFVDALLGDDEDNFEDPELQADAEWGNAKGLAKPIANALNATNQGDLGPRAAGQAGAKRPANAMLSYPSIEVLRLDMFAILNKVTTYDDGRGYSVAYPFMDLPTEEVAPGYFSIIRLPMSFNMVHQRIPSYPSMEAFINDVQQIVTNAHTYNVDGSQICLDIDALAGIFQHQCNLVAQERQLSRMLPQADEEDEDEEDYNERLPSKQVYHPSDPSQGQEHGFYPQPEQNNAYASATAQQARMFVSKPVLMKVPTRVEYSSDDEEGDDGFADNDLRGTGQSFEDNAAMGGEPDIEA